MTSRKNEAIRSRRTSAFTRGTGVALVLGRPGSIWRTYDRGKTWSSSTWNVTPHPLLDFADISDEAVVVGGGGLYRRGRSGTSGWYGSHVAVFTRDLHGIAYAEGRTPIAVGDGGTILRRDPPTVGARKIDTTAPRARIAATSPPGFRFRDGDGLPVDAAGRSPGADPRGRAPR